MNLGARTAAWSGGGWVNPYGEDPIFMVDGEYNGQGRKQTTDTSSLYDCVTGEEGVADGSWSIDTTTNSLTNSAGANYVFNSSVGQMIYDKIFTGGLTWVGVFTLSNAVECCLFNIRKTDQSTTESELSALAYRQNGSINGYMEIHYWNKRNSYSVVNLYTFLPYQKKVRTIGILSSSGVKFICENEDGLNVIGTNTFSPEATNIVDFLVGAYPGVTGNPITMYNLRFYPRIMTIAEQNAFTSIDNERYGTNFAGTISY